MLGWLSRSLNVLLLGESEAGYLGINTDGLKRCIVALVALTVGAGVAATGPIGFVGLVVPHLLRLWIGPDHRYLLPGVILLGAILLIVADLIARTVLAPAELPIGIVTAAMGAPFFLFLLLRQRRRWTMCRWNSRPAGFSRLWGPTGRVSRRFYKYWVGNLPRVAGKWC